jgi:hypothetical protein
VDRIQSVKGKAEMSEQMVKSICSEIRCLDYAKRNITFTITSLKRMIMLSKHKNNHKFSYGYRIAKRFLHQKAI